MDVAIRAIEITRTVDIQRQPVLDELLPEEADIDEMEWLRTASANPAFDFLKEPEEDIYTLADGVPF